MAMLIFLNVGENIRVVNSSRSWIDDTACCSALVGPDYGMCKEMVENDQSLHAAAGRPFECSAGLPKHDYCVTSRAICRLSNLTSLTWGFD